jgi:hypothetical protein
VCQTCYHVHCACCCHCPPQLPSHQFLTETPMPFAATAEQGG